MAERRMFAKSIIDSDVFLDMPQSTQLLYFHLAMRADDDGFVNSPKTIMRVVGAKTDDLNVLFSKKFLIPFESGIVVIRHWRIHNYIRSDRYKETSYQREKSLLFLDKNNAYTQDKNSAKQLVEGDPETEEIERKIPGIPNGYQMDTTGIPNGYQMDTQVRLGKDRIELGKDRITPRDNSACAPARGEDGGEVCDTAFSRFVDKWGINTRSMSNYSAGKVGGIDWDAISEWVGKSSYLQQQKALSFYIDHADDILDGKYFDFKRRGGGKAGTSTNQEVYEQVLENIRKRGSADAG